MVVASPTTSPAESGATVEVRLDDPLDAQSRSYLDLDSGKTFAFGESTPQDYVESRRWMREKGIDTMCETREPSDGLVFYDMVVEKTSNTVDKPPTYADLRTRLEKVDPEPFDLESFDSLPQTLIFRTSDSDMGVLEVSEKMDAPSGLRLRYRIVQPPPPQMPDEVRKALARPWAPPPPPMDPRLVGLLQLRFMTENQIRAHQKNWGPNHPLLIQLRQRLLMIDGQIRQIEVENRKKPAATRPSAAVAGNDVRGAVAQ
jgi:hypothetical protein